MITLNGQLDPVQFFDNLNYTMNPFQRLRQTIDKVNIVYQFDQSDQPEAVRELPVSQPAKQVTSSINDPDELSRVKDHFNSVQNSHIKQINALTSKLEQVTKSLKRAEATVQAQINDIVSLEKENQLLKENLNQQYANIVSSDDKQKKWKEEIYRMSIEINQLQSEIKAEHSNKQQIINSNQRAKDQFASIIEGLKQQLKKVEKERDNYHAQLEERIQMFEYNVKKNAQDRKEYKSQIARNQENYENTLNGYRLDIDRLKHQLFQYKKQVEILSLRKKNVEQNCDRIAQSLNVEKEKNKSLEAQFVSLSKKYEESIKNNEILEQNNSSLGSQLQQQRKNIKLKVVQVRDETVLLELEMYKKQCKELMQEKAIMNSISRSERSIEPGYKIVSQGSK